MYAAPKVGTVQILTNINLNIDKYYQILTDTRLFEKRHVKTKTKQKTTPAARLEIRKHRLWLPIHKQMTLRSIKHIGGYCTILVLNRALYRGESFDKLSLSTWARARAHVDRQSIGKQ